MNYSEVQVQSGGDFHILNLVVWGELVRGDMLVEFYFELVPCICVCVHA